MKENEMTENKEEVTFEPTSEERVMQVLAKLCDRLEKLPRIAIKDGQTSHKVDYDGIDAAMDEARSALNIPHQPVPAKPDLPWHFLKFYG